MYDACMIPSPASAMTTCQRRTLVLHSHMLACHACAQCTRTQVAFPHAAQAIRWALATVRACLEADWPLALLEHELGGEWVPASVSLSCPPIALILPAMGHQYFTQHAHTFLWSWPAAAEEIDTGGPRASSMGAGGGHASSTAVVHTFPDTLVSPHVLSAELEAWCSQHALLTSHGSRFGAMLRRRSASPSSPPPQPRPFG